MGQWAFPAMVFVDPLDQRTKWGMRSFYVFAVGKSGLVIRSMFVAVCLGSGGPVIPG